MHHTESFKLMWTILPSTETENYQNIFRISLHRHQTKHWALKFGAKVPH
jgi:hypothetical protein